MSLSKERRQNLRHSSSSIRCSPSSSTAILRSCSCSVLVTFSANGAGGSAKLGEFRNKFTHSMRCCHTVFGNKTFRLRRPGGEWTPRINASIFQVIATGFADVDINQVTRSSDRIYEAYLDLVTCDQKWVDPVSKSTGDYARIENSFTAWND
jgi:hypothetical protein